MHQIFELRFSSFPNVNTAVLRKALNHGLKICSPKLCHAHLSWTVIFDFLNRFRKTGFLSVINSVFYDALMVLSLALRVLLLISRSFYIEQRCPLQLKHFLLPDVDFFSFSMAHYVVVFLQRLHSFLPCGKLNRSP